MSNPTFSSLLANYHKQHNKFKLRCEEALKNEIRRMLRMNPCLNGFIFAMGYFCFDDKDGAFFDLHNSPKKYQKSLQKCADFLASFGTMTWRIDAYNGELVERTEW